MSDHRSDDQRLREVLSDAVADVRPSDHLGEIRRRTRGRVRGRRRWLPVIAGAGVATAVVVVGTVVVVQLGEPGPGPEEPPTATQPTGGTDRATPLYFLGRTATGPRLFREFQRLPDGARDERVATALTRLTVSAGPDDPDYESFWPDESFVDVAVGGDVVTVDLADHALPQPSDRRPERERRLALQQVVFTAEAVLGDDLPVAFEHDGAPAGQVLGVPVGGPVSRDRQYDAVAPVNISDPVEGATLSKGSRWSASGTAAGFVSEVEWRLTDSVGAVVAGGTVAVTADDPGSTEFPGWSAEIDVELRAGEYVFETRVTDVGESTDAPATFTDTRTVVVR